LQKKCLEVKRSFTRFDGALKGMVVPDGERMNWLEIWLQRLDDFETFWTVGEKIWTSIKSELAEAMKACQLWFNPGS